MALNPPQNTDAYEPKDRKVKLFRPKFNPETGEFLRLHTTIVFLVVRRDPEEIFLSQEFDKEKSKILYSKYRRKIANTFLTAMFDCHNMMIQSGDATSSLTKNYNILKIQISQKITA